MQITGQYLMNLTLNGLLIGTIYGLMALGLTLIFSVLGIVSFAHGEFYMIGGYVVYFLLEAFTDLHPLLAILVAGLVTFLIGLVFERLFWAGFFPPVSRDRRRRAFSQEGRSFL